MRPSADNIIASRASIAAILLIALGGALISACSNAGYFPDPPVPPEQLPAYTLELELRGDPSWDEDGYDITFGFALTADAEFSYNSIIQEIVQETVYRRHDGKEVREHLTLVEAFQLTRVGIDRQDRVRYRLKPFQRDRHFERGYLSLGPLIASADVWRVVRYYPGYVEGADWTPLGFAHLEQNRDGSLISRIPDNFNERHQRRYVVSGKIVEDDRDNAKWYHLRYHWYREPEGNRPQGDFKFRRDRRPTDEPSWLRRILDHGMRTANAGE